MKARKSSLVKITLGLLVLLIITAAFLFGWRVWQNNRLVTPVTTADINNHLDRSVAWLDSNYAILENTKNPILWWRLKQEASNANNKTLANISF